MAEVDYATLSIEKKNLDRPPLEELAKALREGLKSNFHEVLVEIVDCPDLTKKPFTLARQGLDGKPKLVEIGGVPYLLPLVKKEKVYNLTRITNLIDSDLAFIIGAGAGPYPYAGVNCEQPAAYRRHQGVLPTPASTSKTSTKGIFNLNIEYGIIDQQTRISKVDPKNEDVPIQEILPNNETRVALLANLFFSEGQPGKVLKVHVKKRTGDDDFITAIRTVLANKFEDKVIGLGGAFLVKNGKVRQHVMREFSKTPIEDDIQLNNWLKFYNMSTPLIAVGTLVTKDYGLDLRLQHFHSFSHHGEAGHYHNDVSPETVEYLGYFNTGEEIYRIDKPADSHQFGRD